MPTHYTIQQRTTAATALKAHREKPYIDHKLDELQSWLCGETTPFEAKKPNHSGSIITSKNPDKDA